MAQPSAEITTEPSEEATTEPTEEATATPDETQTGKPTTAPSGEVVEVFAGGGGQAPAPGVSAAEAALQRPTGVSVGSNGNTGPQGTGNIFIVDANLGLEITVDQDGRIVEVFTGLLGPQGVGTAPWLGTHGAYPWIADTANNRIVTPNSTGGLTTVAGDPNHASFKGDGGPARRAWLSQPFDVAVPYIDDTTNQRIRYIDPSNGNIITVAGNGTEGFGGDNGPATDAEIANPQAIALSDDRTKLYIADYGNFRIREVDLGIDLGTGTITTIAGTGDGTAIPYDKKLTGLATPVTRASAIAVDLQGNVYFPTFWGDIGENIMRLARDGTMTRIMGGGTVTEAGGDPLEFALPDVLGLAIDPFDGSLFVCGSDSKVYRLAGVAQPG